MTQVMACIDGSQSTRAVCDYAAWASQRLSAPLTLLHVLDEVQYPTSPDLSGTIGLGSREHLLEELANLDQQRHKLAMEQGRLMLEAARERVQADGVEPAQLRQRHGDLVDCLHELEADIRLLVIGRQGKTSDSLSQLVGSHLENVIRTLHRPILVSCGEFKAPQSYMLAYDGSATARKSLEMIAASPLLKGLPCHLVMIGAESSDAWSSSRPLSGWCKVRPAQCTWRFAPVRWNPPCTPTSSNRASTCWPWVPMATRGFASFWSAAPPAACCAPATARC